MWVRVRVRLKDWVCASVAFSTIVNVRSKIAISVRVRVKITVIRQYNAVV